MTPSILTEAEMAAIMAPGWPHGERSREERQEELLRELRCFARPVMDYLASRRTGTDVDRLLGILEGNAGWGLLLAADLESLEAGDGTS